MDMITELPLASYEPDRAQHARNVSNVILNAKPVKDGWGPLPSLVTFTDALAAAPRGHFTAIAPGGTIATFAFTVDTAYKLEADFSWTDVDGGSTYALPTGDKWSGALFGSRFIVTNSADGPLYWDIGTSTAFATLPGSPPSAKYVRVVGDFVVLGNISGTPNRVAWSGVNDSEEWTPRTKLAGGQTFPDGGAVQGIIDVPNGAIVFQRDVIRSMTFNPGSGLTFTFAYANEKRGCLAPNSIAKIGAGDFVFLSKEGFFRGLNNPIGAERVDRTFFANADPAYVEQTEAVADPTEKVVWFRYRTVDASYALLGYDWQLDRWFASDLDAVGFGTFATSALTLEDLDTLYPAGLESVPFSLDSREFQGGRPEFGAFDSSYKLGYLTGLPQAATLETATVQLSPNGRSFVSNAELIGDLGALTSSSLDDTDISIDDIDGSIDDYAASDFSMQLGGQDFHAKTLTFTDVSYPNLITGMCPFRKSARLHRARVITRSNAVWSYVAGVRLHHVDEGNQ